MTENEENLLFPRGNETDDDDDDEDDLTDVTGGNAYEHPLPLYNGYDEHQHLNTEYKTSDIENDIDPERHFYGNININCEYYTEEKFNKHVEMGDSALSVLHVNSRSLYTKLEDFKDYLCKFKKFNVIAVTETWLNETKQNDMQLDGYELFTTNRCSKIRGGGVALYIDTALRCSKITSMSKTVEHIMECVTIEIKLEKAANIIISCVYRTPGTSVDIFNEQFSSMWDKVSDS